jgi:hypothetical protein
MRAACVVATLLSIVSTAAAKPKPAPLPPPPTITSSDNDKPARLPGDRRRIVGILDVRVDGVPKEIADRFESSLEEELDSNAYWLASRARMHEMMESSTKWSEGCIVGTCLSEVRTQTGADLVLLAALNGSGTSFGYVVTLVRTDTGRMLAQESQRCDVCTVNEALTGATSAAVKLLVAVPEKLPDEEAAHRHALELVADKGKEDTAVAKHHHRKTATLVTLAGIAVAAIGATLYYTQDHADYGLATAAGGVGLAVGGGIALTF